jgi:hypothetical protein
MASERGTNRLLIATSSASAVSEQKMKVSVTLLSILSLSLCLAYVEAQSLCLVPLEALRVESDRRYETSPGEQERRVRETTGSAD